jgi:type I restriction enzyme S subunit
MLDVELPVQWRWVTLGDVADPKGRAIVSGPFGSNIGSRFFVEQGVPVIRGNNLTADMRRFVDYGFVFVTEEKAQELKNCEAVRDDLVFTAAGSLGQVGIIPQHSRFPRYIISNKQMRARVNKESVEPLFAFYWFSSPPMVEYVQQRNTGSSVPLINLSVLRSLPFPLPPRSEQCAIASVLGALDDKIELNRRMNETLEAMARALFQSWFVDATQAGLPKSWREGKVSDLATLSRDGLNPGEFPDEIFDHYSIPAFDEGRTPKPETGDTIKSNKFIVSPDCVLVSKLNPRIPRVWLPDLRGENRAICSTEFLIMIPKPGVSREFLFCLFTNESFISVFATMVTGTSGSHQRVKPESLLGMDAVIPPQSLIRSFTEMTAPLLERVNHNIAESRTLAALRDPLLPKLLSGEIRVTKNNLLKW